MKGMGMRGVRDEDSSEGGVEMKVVDLRRNFFAASFFSFLLLDQLLCPVL